MQLRNQTPKWRVKWKFWPPRHFHRCGKKKPLSNIVAEAINEDLILIETLNQIEALEFEEYMVAEGTLSKTVALV